MAIHEEVRNARKALGITPAELARRSGVPRSLVGRFESGGNITVETLVKLVRQLPNLDSVQFGDVKGIAAGPGADVPSLLRQHFAASQDLMSAVTRLTEATAQLIAMLEPDPPASK